MSNYDLLVVGAGPGGYIAAVEAAKMGKKVAIIEKNKIGGTCLNVGCIPSKTYLKNANWMEELKVSNKFGIKSELLGIDFPKLVERKDEVVTQLQNGIHYLFKRNKVDYFKGEAKIVSNHEIVVNDQRLQADFILLATGSHPFVPPIVGIDTVDYLTTDTFFELRKLPNQLVIIGGGVIGIELAFAMAPLGTAVTVLEVAPRILMTEDDDAVAIIRKKLQELGIVVFEACKINQIREKEIILDNQVISFDQLLISTGRKSNLLLAEQLQLTITDNKFVKVNQYYQTSTKNIYAIGDIIDGYMLAHVASKEGIKAVRHMFGEKERPVKKSQVPRCVYTHPEIASFGLNEAEAKEQGYDILVSQISYSANGRAIVGNETTGFVKIIADKKYHEILGSVVVGANATELIHILLAIKETEGSLDELEKMIFAHPTLSEMIGELANEMIF